MALHPPAGGWRVVDHPTHGSTEVDGANGVFLIASVEPGWKLLVMSSTGEGWEHLSVHAFREYAKRVQIRTPNWREMTDVKRRCWDPEDVAMQLHPAEAEYINIHPHVLHLWRLLEATIPLPPLACV